MSAEGWAVIIAAVSLGVVQAITALFSGMAFYKSRVAALATEATAIKVSKALATSSEKSDIAEKASKDRDNAIVKTIVEVKKELNGHMAHLLRVTGEAERAKGVLEGKLQGPPGQEAVPNEIMVPDPRSPTPGHVDVSSQSPR